MWPLYYFSQALVSQSILKPAASKSEYPLRYLMKKCIYFSSDLTVQDLWGETNKSVFSTNAKSKVGESLLKLELEIGGSIGVEEGKQEKSRLYHF